MSKPISKKTVWIVSLGFFIILSVYTLFQYQKIKTRIPAEKTGTRANKDRKPIRVPQFVALEKVFYRSRFYFTFDSPQTLEEYRETENLDGVVEGWENDFDLARKLMNWCRAQWEPGRPDPYPPINAMEILREIRAKRTGGFCAQYNYIFVQGLQSFGILARYATILHHEVTEVWIQQYQKWICFDPLYDAYYTDQLGTPLTVLEIHQQVKNQRPVRIRANQPVADVDSHLQQFRQFAIWIKNNHISSPINFSDLEYFKVYFIESPDLKTSIPSKALSTANPADLYFNPDYEKRQKVASAQAPA